MYCGDFIMSMDYLRNFGEVQSSRLWDTICMSGDGIDPGRGGDCGYNCKNLIY